MLDIKTIKPTRGKLLAEPITGDYESASGLVVVRDIKKGRPPEKAKIIARGGPFYDKKRRVQVYRAAVGDMVYIKRQAGQPIYLNGKEFLVLKNEEIVGVEK